MFSNLDKSPAVKYLLIINVAIYFLISTSSPLYASLTLHYIDHPDFHVWQLITHMFLHGSMTHILFNMFALYQFGAVMEQQWGTKRFLIFYFAAGLGGALLYNFNLGAITNYLSHSFMPVHSGIINTLPQQLQLEIFRVVSSQAVGASAAIMGIVVAFAYIFPNTKLMLIFFPVPISAKYLIGAVVAWDIIAGLLGTLTMMGMANYNDNIAHFAHIGGALVGIILLMYWQKNRNTFY